MKKRIFLFLCLQLCIFGVYPDWTNQIVNYSRNNYQAGSQNWQITQHNNGWMYFANKMGVLEYNGVGWNLYTMNNRQDVRSLLKSKDNQRIYLGGVNELGYLAPNATGQLKYHCVSEKMPKNEVTFGNIWNIYELENTIYFCADQSIVRWKDNQSTTIDSPDKIDCSHVIDNTIYIGTSSGIYILAGNTFYRIPESSSLINKKIRGISAWGENILIATAFNGLYLLGKDHLVPFETEADSFLKKNELFSMAVNRQTIAIGTVLNGVILFEDKGRKGKYFNESHGLQNNTILSLFFDKEENLWLGLDNGISYIALSNPVTNLYSAPNFYGAGYTAALFENKLYLGTNRGLYFIDWPVNHSESAPQLKLIEKMQGQIWNLSVWDDELVCCMDRGLFIIGKNGSQKLDLRSGTWKIKQTIADKNQAWLSTYNGFYLLEKENGNWSAPQYLAGFHGSVINFEEAEPNLLIIKNSWDDIQKLFVNDSTNRILRIESFKPPDFPLNANPSKINGQIKLCSPEGFFQYQQDRFFPDKQLNLHFKDVQLPFKSLLQTNSNTWALSNNTIASYNPRTNQTLYVRHRIPLISNFEDMISLDDTSVIICNENGFALYKSKSLPTKPKEISLQIIQVSISKLSDSIIYMNNFAGKITLPEIAYKNNSLRFTCNLLDYSNETTPLFQYRLDDQAWTEPTAAASKEISDINIGKHTLHIKTQSIDGLSYSVSFPFVILPPWYRTNWAYLFYTLLLICLLLLIIYWDNKRIEKKKKQVEMDKEKEMKVKEDVFRIESEQKEQEIFHLRNEHLKQEIDHKTQELANFAIHLVRKNEILTEIKSDIGKVSDFIKSDKEMDVPSLRRKVFRINNKIEQNILHDDSLKKFEEHFDLVHNNFMHRLSEKYPSLTLNERKMCAFIKMQMSSKEIAPLLSISIRGVETLRYRLRKKLNLEREQSLTLFLNQF